MCRSPQVSHRVKRIAGQWGEVLAELNALSHYYYCDAREFADLTNKMKKSVKSEKLRVSGLGWEHRSHLLSS